MKTRTKNIISWVLSLIMIVAGGALIASFFLAGSLSSTATNEENPGGFSVPRLESADRGSTGGPEDKTLELTIPAMARIDKDEVPSSEANEEQLKNYAAVHLQGTGHPWEDEANVYIAGHRLGYPNTESFLTFWDLNELENGDRVFVTDANGTEYTYEVFKEFTVSPTDLSVTEPIPGKNVLTLQSCTLPDYSQRLVVQAELIETSA
ncbi:MAG TPA: class E sortase [Rubrobacteraceae bacterium]|nr:class E sortase [Rubrobacteraceae bacterium]